MIEGITFTGNPKHGVVRKVRSLETENATFFINRFADEITKMTEDDSDFNINDALVYLMQEHPDEFLEFSENSEKIEMLSVISLGTDKLWTIEELDDMPYDDVDELYEKSLDALGGDIDRFFKKSRLNSKVEKPKKTRKSPAKKNS